MDAHAFLARLQAQRHYRGQIAAARVLPARPATFRTPATPLPDRLRDLVAHEGIAQLYAHQADAYDAARAGRHVAIATGTASGKSLCYNLPVLADFLAGQDPRALYLYPAKALAYDQLGALQRLVDAGDLADLVRPACYDGDTPTHKRPGIRRNAGILLSNPDMLHQSILPYHAKWAGFFARLRYIVLDEIHTYRGIFGSHVAGVLRRLRRICRHYGADPQFICSSATLGNPRELAQRLAGVDDLVLIERDDSPRGQKLFVLWNPPWLEDGLKLARRSANVEAQELMQRLLEDDAGTLTFCKARVVAELLYKYLHETLQRRRPDLARRIRPYRGGYLPLERREIERQLFSGELLGVCSTNALELGIDVGALDAALIVGFPGTLCSLWQQAGRAGRRQDESLCVFIAYDDPVDQYLMRNPDFIFNQPLEHAIVDPANPHILAAQLGCAAFELPLAPEDLADFGALAPDVAAVLRDDGKLRHTAGKDYWATSDFAASSVNLRTISNATFAIVDTTAGANTVIGQVDSISAPELVYPEAVYLHHGDSYLVRELDWPARLARVERLDADYYTQPVLADDCRVTAERLAGECRGGRKFFGDVSVKWQTVAFRKFKHYTQELIGQTVLDLPPQQIDTRGVWFQPPPAALDAARAALDTPPLDATRAVLDAARAALDRATHDPATAPARAVPPTILEALSGVRNLLMVALPPLAMCDRYDLGGVVNTSQFGVSTIILYDRYAGGVGYARHGYECAEQLFELAYELAHGCECEHGCPGCVGPPNLRIAIHQDPDVGQGYAIPDKRAVLTLLAAWRRHSPVSAP